jgi:hypothetical protein
MIEATVILLLLGILITQQIQRKNEQGEHERQLQIAHAEADRASGDYAALLKRLEEKALTPRAPKVQDEQQRAQSGAQLRKLNQQQNVAAWERMQERPNSEVLRGE